MAAMNMNQEQFKQLIREEKPVLVDFWAPWCGPCKAIGPLVEEIAGEYANRVKVMKLNVDESQKSAVAFGVRSIPTLILFKDGKVLDTLVGMTPKEKLEEFVKKSL